MANIIDYVHKYGDVLFENKKFNEVDNLIFSVLTYLDFSNTRINENCHTLEEIGRVYMRQNSYKSVRKLGIAMGDAYLLLKEVVEANRYRHLIEMSCSFPVPSHVEATKYLNEHVKLLGPKVIVCGHSKGGNLALVAAMFMNKIKSQRIKAIYNNDGPGLRDAEFESEGSPKCPVCGKSMRKVVARKGRYIGKSFWGCSDYPNCNGTRDI